MSDKGKMLAALAGFATGVLTGGYLVFKKFDTHYEEITQEIYNQCYREAKEDLMKDQVEREDREEHTRIVKTYVKPDLQEVARERLPAEQEPPESGDILDDENPEDTSQRDADLVEAEMMHDAQIARALMDDAEKPVVEFIEEGQVGDEPNYHKMDVFFYASDEVFTDEDDQMLTEEELSTMFDTKRIEAVSKLRHEEKVYFRNNRLEADYDLYRLKASYNEIAFETAKERERRISRRKNRG